MKTLRHLLSGIIMITRDMFLGFILSIGCAAILYKINPKMYRTVGLLIPIGVISGSLKGFTKLMLMKLYCNISESDYRLNYPRFKIFFLWMTLFVGTMTFVYGMNPGLWFSAPVSYLKDNVLLNTVSPEVWKGACIFISVIGVLAYLYEPKGQHRSAEQNSPRASDTKSDG